MTYKIQGEAPFQVLASNFSIGPSNEGYTLQISADGVNYSNLFSVGANVTRMVTGVANGSYYRLNGNNSIVSVNWERQCNDGGSGGGSGSQGPQGTQGPAGGGSGSGVTPALVQAMIEANNENLANGDPIVGMARQLYSPDGVTSNETYLYRTTAGAEDIGSGPAELKRVGGHYPSVWNDGDASITYTPGNGEDVSVDYNYYPLMAALENTEGEYTYSYDGTDWTPALPDGITIDGTPEAGASITIDFTETTWTPIEMRPEDFVSVGLNSYNKDSDTEICSTVDGDRDNYVITIKAVRGLQNGYVVYSTTSAITNIQIISDDDDAVATEIVAGALYVAYPNNEYPNIEIVTTDKDSICVHPRWSGIKDDVYEEYTESRVNLADFPELYMINSDEGHYDYVDLERGVYVQWVDKEAFSWERFAELEDDGVAYETDGDYIYTLLDEPNETPITVPDMLYTANDFGVEYYCANGELIDNSLLADWGDYNEYGMITETFYMNNLVDKLRRINGLVHLDNLNGTGNENTIYECDDRLWYWSSTSGPVAEWTNKITDTGFGTNRGYGLIFSHIPDGQTLFESKYQYDGDGEYKSFKMSGNTLVMTNTGGTVLSACTVGETKEFRVRSGSLGASFLVKTKVEKHWIGFEIQGAQLFRNLWDGTVTGGHFGIVDHTNYPYLVITTDTGIAMWNSKGQVVRKDSSYSVKDMYFNVTGTPLNGRLTVLTNGAGNGPNHIFGPENGGTAGQILTSNGNAAPVWSDWIKAVKITSDEYEALVTKDPNTLYLIVDE